MTLEFLWVAVVIELTPGPNMLVLASLAARHGAPTALMAVAGVTAGLGAYLVASALGLGVALAQAPMLLAALRWAGVAYLVWLAYEAATQSAQGPPAAIAADGDAALTPSGDARRYFWRGFLVNLLNAKAAVFYAVLLPHFMTPDGPPYAIQALGLGLVHLGVATSVHLAIVLSAGAAATALQQAVDSRAVRYSFAAALLASAAWLAVSA